MKKDAIDIQYMKFHLGGIHREAGGDETLQLSSYGVHISHVLLYYFYLRTENSANGELENFETSHLKIIPTLNHPPIGKSCKSHYIYLIFSIFGVKK